MFFKQPIAKLFSSRRDVKQLLKIKGYKQHEIVIYLDAFDYFSNNIQFFDGATIVKDLCDIPDLDLDAMLHDYHYLKYKVGANFSTKWKADWTYAKGNERKGKGQYSAFSRFIGLTIIGIGFVPYTYLKKGKITPQQKEQFLNEYRILIP